MNELTVFALMIISGPTGAAGQLAGLYDSMPGCMQAKYELEIEERRLVKEMRIPPTTDKFYCEARAVHVGILPPFSFGQ